MSDMINPRAAWETAGLEPEETRHRMCTSTLCGKEVLDPKYLTKADRDFIHKHPQYARVVICVKCMLYTTFALLVMIILTLCGFLLIALMAIFRGRECNAKYRCPVSLSLED